MFLLLSNETSLKKAFAIITVHRNGKILEKNYSTIINIGNKGDSILYYRLLLRFLFTLDRRDFFKVLLTTWASQWCLQSQSCLFENI